MNKFLHSTAALTLLAAAASAQITYSEDFTAGANGWTGTGYAPGWFSDATVCGGSGGAFRTNAYSGATSVTVLSPSLGTSAGASTTVTFDYKIHNWSPNTVATAGNWGSVDLEYSDSAAGPWTVAGTWSNEAQTSGVCLTRTAPSFNPVAGPLFIRFRGTWSTGDWWMNIDNVVVTDTACSGAPVPGDTIGPATPPCAGSTIALGLQFATPGGGVTYQWFENGNPILGATGATLSTVIPGDTLYFCEVTCTASSSTTASNPLFVTVDPSASNTQTFETGIDSCWSNVGGLLPDLRPVSGFGIGAQAVRFAFDGWGNQVGAQSFLTSSLITTNPGDKVFFDWAGAVWTGFGPDTMHVEESTDGGVTWSTVVSGTNAVGGLFNTAGTMTVAFVPTAAQWAEHSYSLSSGVNRVRIRGVSGWGNDCFIDNIHVGTTSVARHYKYGVSCVPGYEINATPPPLPGTTVSYTANNIPQWVGVGVYGSALAFGFAGDVPGTDMFTATFGTFNSPCLVHLTLAGFVDLIFLPNNVPNDGLNLTIPPLCPLGAELFVQGVAQTDSTIPNPSGLVTSMAIRTYVGNY